MGIFLGLIAAVCFAASSVLLRIGMRTSPRDDGLYMTIFVNVLALAAVGLFVDRPDWSTEGIIILAVAGLLGTVAGRHVSLRALRLVGATRTSVFVTGTPGAAAIAGWFVLDETLGLVDALGGLLVAIGLILLAASRSSAAPVRPGEAQASTFAGYAYAVATPIAFGLAFVVRKWGLRSYDSAVLGALIGALAAIVFLTAADAVRGNLKGRLVDNFVDVNWWFVAAGAAISMALITQFSAFSFVPAWVVGALQGTQAFWVSIMGYLFFRAEERIDRTVVISMLVVAAGVTLISVAV